MENTHWLNGGMYIITNDNTTPVLLEVMWPDYRQKKHFQKWSPRFFSPYMFKSKWFCKCNACAIISGDAPPGPTCVLHSASVRLHQRLQSRRGTIESFPTRRWKIQHLTGRRHLSSHSQVSRRSNFTRIGTALHTRRTRGQTEPSRCFPPQCTGFSFLRCRSGSCGWWYLDAASHQVGHVLLTAALQPVEDEASVLFHLDTQVGCW